MVLSLLGVSYMSFLVVNPCKAMMECNFGMAFMHEICISYQLWILPVVWLLVYCRFHGDREIWTKIKCSWNLGVIRYWSDTHSLTIADSQFHGISSIERGISPQTTDMIKGANSPSLKEKFYCVQSSVCSIEMLFGHSKRPQYRIG